MWALIVVGILGLAAGVVTFLWPGMTALVLLMFIASWAVLMGIFEIAAAIRLRKHIENEWLLALSGVVSIAFGVLMFLQPGPGALAVVWLIGSFSLLFGILLIVLGFKLKGLAGRLATGGRTGGCPLIADVVAQAFLKAGFNQLSNVVWCALAWLAQWIAWRSAG